MSTSFDDKVKKAGDSYRPEPKLKWEDIEARLDNKKKGRRFTFLPWLAAAASIAVLVTFIFIFVPKFTADDNDTLFAQSSSISDLQLQSNSSESKAEYSVKEVYYAYHQAGLLEKRN